MCATLSYISQVGMSYLSLFYIWAKIYRRTSLCFSFYVSFSLVSEYSIGRFNISEVCCYDCMSQRYRMQSMFLRCFNVQDRETVRSAPINLINRYLVYLTGLLIASSWQTTTHSLLWFYDRNSGSYLISSSNLYNNVNGFLPKKSAITPHDEDTARQLISQGIQNSLDKVLRVARFLERFDAFS